MFTRVRLDLGGLCSRAGRTAGPGDGSQPGAWLLGVDGERQSRSGEKVLSLVGAPDADPASEQTMREWERPMSWGVISDQTRSLHPGPGA